MNHDESSQHSIPIACRFVASDQWLTTQLDPSWKVSEVKQYILTKVYTKCVTTHDFPLTDERPVSPITFASAFDHSRQSFDSTDGLLEFEEDSITDSDSHSIDPFRQRRARQQPASRATPPDVPSSPTQTHSITTSLPPYHYQILAFSTGQLLEDDFSLSWYHLRPHELLELHPPGTIVPLQRETMVDYIQPYLEFDVRALRVVVNDKDSSTLGLAHAHGLELCPGKIWKAREAAAESRATATCGGSCCSSAQQTGRKRRKTKLEWRDRYLVIRQGILSLFKSRSDPNPVHTCSLSTLTTLRGKEDVVHTSTSSSAMTSPHVIFAKFCVQVSSPGLPESHPSSSSPMIPEIWNDPWSGGIIPQETDGHLWGRRESKEDIKQQRKNTAEGCDRSRRGSFPKEDQHECRLHYVKDESLWFDINTGDSTQGTWVVLDTLDDFAYSNLLRVLHRSSPDTISSTLVPSNPLLDSVSSSPSSTSSPLSSSHTGGPRRPSYPYPEWRMEVSRRAQKSGMGDLSDAMSWMLCGPPVDSFPFKSRTELHKNRFHLATESSGTSPDQPVVDVNNEPGDDDEYCDLEWDSWPRDLTRQARVGASKYIPVNITESFSSYLSHGRDRVAGHTASSSPASTVLSYDQSQPTSPSPLARHHPQPHQPVDIIPGMNMDVLSVDSPALLTAPSVLPFQSTGVTTSTVSAGGIVRTRSLISKEGGRGRGVARAMEVIGDVSGAAHLPGARRHRVAEERRRAREELNYGGPVSPTRGKSLPPLPTGVITSTVTVREASAPSPTHQPYVSHFGDLPPAVPVASHATLETAAPTAPAAATTTMTATTTTTVRLLPRRLSSPEGDFPSPGKGGDKVGKERRLKRASSRGKTFSPERLVSRLDSALEFVSG